MSELIFFKNVRFILHRIVWTLPFLCFSAFAAPADKAQSVPKGGASNATLVWIIIGGIAALIIGLVIYLNHKEKLRVKAEWEARKARVLEKYGEEIGSIILEGKIKEGMTEEMLFESWGEPGKREDSVLRGKAIINYFFVGSRNQRGNMKFAQRVTVENGLVIGWKDGNF